MSVITKIEQQRNKSRVNIFVDDSFFCGLERETAAVFGLKTGKQVNEEYLKEALKLLRKQGFYEEILSIPDTAAADHCDSLQRVVVSVCL